MQNDREQAYVRRFNRVLDFIDEHLDGDLSIKRMARMRRASYRLAVNPLQSITHVAQEACFENSESFRRNPEWASWRLSNIEATPPG